MSLTKEERRTLYKFLWLYLGSSFILSATIAYLFYKNELYFFYDSTNSKMQIASSRLASKITHAHMTNIPFSFEKALKDVPYRVGFFTKDNKIITSNLIDSNNSIRLMDKSTFGHLGVDYIIIQKEGISNYIKNLQYKIVLALLIVYLIIGVIGYFLAKLFIKPIQLKRVQLDNFIKDSTHELNTPVTALLLSVNSPMLNSPKNLERIRLSAMRISEIHKDLSYLLLSNLNIKVEDELLLNSIIKKKLTYLKAIADKKNIDLRVDYRDKLYFKIDEESFSRLINNLISNAIKYNKMGGEINIIVDRSSITIEDTGIGVAKDKQDEIYRRFYRATDQAGGFGLGLNIVYNIAKRFNIKIDMSSKLNIGTTFKLTFNPL